MNPRIIDRLAQISFPWLQMNHKYRFQNLNPITQNNTYLTIVCSTEGY